MKKKNNTKRFQLDKRSIARLNASEMNQMVTGLEAEPDFLSLFACKTRKCATELNCPTLQGCPDPGTITLTVTIQ